MFSFGRRKVQKTRYTHWITLPPEWLINVGVGKGDELILEMSSDKSLKLSRPASKDPIQYRS